MDGGNRDFYENNNIGNENRMLEWIGKKNIARRQEI